ncbi:MAG: DUF4270 family protein [Niabella sp.]
MYLYRKIYSKGRFLIVLFIASVLFSCDKVDIPFKSTDETNDPNITYLENSKIEVATYKPDSFSTSGHQVFTIGYHNDPVFGIAKAGSMATLSLPTTNDLADKDEENLHFDSIVVVLAPKNIQYGDSSKPFTFRIHELTNKISTDNPDGLYYNNSNVEYNPTPIASRTVNLYGRSGEAITIRLPDAMGKAWMELFRKKDEQVSTQDFFEEYFKGLYITADSMSTGSIVNFSTASDTALVRIHYKEIGLTTEEKVFKFSYDVKRQFNNISFRYTNPVLSTFVTDKKQTIPSEETNNHSYLNTYMGTTVQINFTDLLSLKERNPYIHILKAELVIHPDKSFFGITLYFALASLSCS